ncbi:MAG: GGDEF domain-containing protein [Rubrivivax sp.]|nr:GGDEF domain-containing protein [Rubrivivax sp.]
MAESAALLEQAWELSYLRPLAARDIGLRLASAGGPYAAMGWLHVALAEVRVGDATVASDALRRARQAFAASQNVLGLTWCDEIRSIELRRAGDYAGSARLQAEIDGRSEVGSGPMYEFVSHNTRAITAKLLGRNDDALRHFYAASDAATRTGWAGPRIIALCNLGGFQLALYNLEDARRLSEEGLAAAREAEVAQAVVTAATNLINIYHAEGEMRQARAMVDFLVTHQSDLVTQMLPRYALSLALGLLGVGEIDAALVHLEAGAVAAVSDGDGQTLWAWLKARCLLAKGDAPGARAVAEQTMQQRRQRQLQDQPFETMQLHLALADACEAVGDTAAALACMREAHARYEELVGRSARARYVALEVTHELARTQRERDRALDSHRSAEDDRHRLAELNSALQAQIAETELLHVRLRDQALRDPLTGLHNRRYLFEMAPGLLELARRQASPLCVALIDLDHFKLLNDTYGHQAGDQVLLRFATLLTQILRRSDVICRHGGEEFVAVMPDIDGEGAQAVLGRLLEAFQTQQPAEPGRRRLPGGSFSAGIALFPRHGQTLEQLLTRADRALYAAKNHGRARVELAPATGFGTLT